MANKSESKTYQAMFDEVEGIVKNVSSAQMDLDRLVENVERGYSLIQAMRTRLDEAKMKIEKLREEHEKADEDDTEEE